MKSFLPTESVVRTSMTQFVFIYRVSTLKVEHRQLTLCIQFIDIMPLFRYIKELNYNIKVLNSLSSFYYKLKEFISLKKLQCSSYLS
jgi:hypothetical protein